jgi:hypothetical protein
VSDKPNLRVLSENKRFILRDESDFRYGQYDTREQAEQALEDWKAYFDAPLVF